MATADTITLIEELEKTLVDFIRTHHVNHETYRRVTDLVIASIKQGEESLIFDVLFEAAASDVSGEESEGSTPAIEGPFYLQDAPYLQTPYVMPQRDGERGTQMTFSGVVRATDGTPLPGAELDVWHADADGLYSQVHYDLPQWNLRARFTTDADGAFSLATIVPPPYEIPKDGGTGTMLNALGRHFFRPAHVHVKVRAAGHRDLTSQLYFRGGEYIDTDVAHAVRDGLLIDVTETDHGLVTTYDFVLDPALAAVPA